VTLCALYTTEPKYLKLLKKYKEDEPSEALEHASLTRCLSMIQRMNDSDGKYSTNLKAS
jgi:hypothetical protein